MKLQKMVFILNSEAIFNEIQFDYLANNNFELMTFKLFFYFSVLFIARVFFDHT